MSKTKKHCYAAGLLLLSISCGDLSIFLSFVDPQKRGDEKIAAAISNKNATIKTKAPKPTRGRGRKRKPGKGGAM